MPTSTHKKVIVRCLAPGKPASEIHGYLDLPELEKSDPLPVLSVDGTRILLAREQVQAVYLVSEFMPREALTGARCWGKPGTRMPGLWVRVHGWDGFYLDGVLATSLLGLREEIWLTPLYGSGPCQRVYLPPQSVRRLDPVAYVRPVPPRRRRAIPGQIDLFEPFAAEAGEESR